MNAVEIEEAVSEFEKTPTSKLDVAMNFESFETNFDFIFF